jgi:4-amino-4-deoxy-L-arabinose transferase-like glycosyltransferase
MFLIRRAVSPFPGQTASAKETAPMSRRTALALVAALWAAIYLPGLGSTELKGEEGRRVLPAVTMLETGNWLVPSIGGEPYLRKPPLVNWAIALSFKITGVRNEWTARLPSALCVLLLGLTIVAVASRSRGALAPSLHEVGAPRLPASPPGDDPWLDVETSLIAALMAMTFFGLLAKAKFAGAEIEGLYAPLTGMAIVCWLAWRAQGRSPWLVWCVPGALLGLACLAKGPSLHLLYHYAIVLAVLWREKALRQLVHPAHLAGLALCAAIFAAWAVPYFRSPEAATAAEVWKRQGLDRFTDSDFNLRNYLTNLPRALGDLLPWVLLVVPILRARRRPRGGPLDVGCSDSPRPEKDHPARGAGEKHPTLNIQHPTSNGLLAAVLATAACFLGVLLIPGTLPRYVLPLGAPLAVGLAAAVVRSGRWARPVRLVVQLTAAIAVAMLLYAILVAPRLNARATHRPLAAQIDAALPPGATLFVHDPGYFAALFYLRTPYRYAPRTEDIPADAAWLLARANDRAKLEKKRPDLRLAHTFPTRDGKAWHLYHRE